MAGEILIDWAGATYRPDFDGGLEPVAEIQAGRGGPELCGLDEYETLEQQRFLQRDKLSRQIVRDFGATSPMPGTHAALEITLMLELDGAGLAIPLCDPITTYDEPAQRLREQIEYYSPSLEHPQLPVVYSAK